MNYDTLKCPFCKEILTKEFHFTYCEYYCGTDKCNADNEEWSRYVVITYDSSWIQKITVGGYYVINRSDKETTELHRLTGCIYSDQMDIPKMQIDPSFGEEKIYEVLKTFLVFS